MSIDIMTILAKLMLLMVAVSIAVFAGACLEAGNKEKSA